MDTTTTTTNGKANGKAQAPVEATPGELVTQAQINAMNAAAAKLQEATAVLADIVAGTGQIIGEAMASSKIRERVGVKVLSRIAYEIAKVEAAKAGYKL